MREGREPGAAAQGLDDIVVEQHGRERRVPAGQSLAAEQHVGDDVLVEAREPVAGTPDPGDDLVHDEEDAVPVAQLPQTYEVAPGWHEDSSCRTDDGLDDDRSDGIRSVLEDRGVEPGNEALRTLVFGLTRQTVPDVGVWRLRERVDQAAVVETARGLTRQRQGTECHPVVAGLATEDLCPPGLTSFTPVHRGGADRELCGFGPRGDEVRPVELRRCDRRQLRSEGFRRFARELRSVHERDLAGLCAQHIGDLAQAVPERCGHRAAGPVEVLAPFGVVEVDTAAVRHRRVRRVDRLLQECAHVLFSCFHRFVSRQDRVARVHQAADSSSSVR